MTRGDGCLFVATGLGVKEAGVHAEPVRRVNSGMWRDYCAVAWIAAWAKQQGYTVHGHRELLLQPDWNMHLSWVNRRRTHEVVIQPAVVAVSPDEEHRTTLDTALGATQPGQLRATLREHSRWQSAGKTQSAFYMCATKQTAARIRRLGAQYGLDEADGTLMVQQLDPIRGQVVTVHAHRPSVTSHPARRQRDASEFS
jgi:hypothetical protein